MKLIIAGICLLSACGSPTLADPLGYTPPARTPYDAKPKLKAQYLRAHRAGWNSEVSTVSDESLEKVLRGESEILGGAYNTCCEATPNVTRGFFEGASDARRFLARISVKTDHPEEILKKVQRLKKEALAHPIEDWFVADSYRPTDLVEVSEQGGSVIRTYRDATRTQVHEIRQVKDGQNHGRRESYDVNGALRTVSQWVDGIREGEEISYSDTGDVWGRSTYRHDKRHGPEVYFGDDGLLKDYFEYEEGFRQGRQVDWGPDGKLTQFFRWKFNQKDGRCLSYAPEGARVELFEAGEQVGSTSDPVPVDQLPEEERPATLNRLREQFRR